MDELDGPNVVLLRLFLLWRRHHIHPLVAPLSHGETFDELVCIESGDRRYRTFEVIVFGVSRTVGASRLSTSVEGCGRQQLRGNILPGPSRRMKERNGSCSDVNAGKLRRFSVIGWRGAGENKLLLGLYCTRLRGLSRVAMEIPVVDANWPIKCGDSRLT